MSTANPKRVLVVDFDTATLTATKALLEQRGFEVETGASVREVRKVLEAGPPAVIVIEPDLAGTDGFSLCDSIPDLCSGPTPAMLMASRSLRSGEAQQRAGDIRFFERPAQDALLVGAIAEALGVALDELKPPASDGSESAAEAGLPSVGEPVASAGEAGASNPGGPADGPAFDLFAPSMAPSKRGGPSLDEMNDDEFEGWIDRAFADVTNTGTDSEPAAPEPAVAAAPQSEADSLTAALDARLGSGLPVAPAVETAAPSDSQTAEPKPEGQDPSELEPVPLSESEPVDVPTIGTQDALADALAARLASRDAAVSKKAGLPPVPLASPADAPEAKAESWKDFRPQVARVDEPAAPEPIAVAPPSPSPPPVGGESPRHPPATSKPPVAPPRPEDAQQSMVALLKKESEPAERGPATEAPAAATEAPVADPQLPKLEDGAAKRGGGRTYVYAAGAAIVVLGGAVIGFMMLGGSPEEPAAVSGPRVALSQPPVETVPAPALPVAPTPTPESGPIRLGAQPSEDGGSPTETSAIPEAKETVPVKPVKSASRPAKPAIVDKPKPKPPDNRAVEPMAKPEPKRARAKPASRTPAVTAARPTQNRVEEEKAVVQSAIAEPTATAKPPVSPARPQVEEQAPDAEPSAPQFDSPSLPPGRAEAVQERPAPEPMIPARPEPAVAAPTEPEATGTQAPAPLPASPRQVVIVQPRLIPSSRVAPEYPAAARRLRAGGTVVLRAIVQTDGSLADVEIIRDPSRQAGLGRAAVAAVRRWRYEPGSQDGKPAEMPITIEVEFNPN